MTSRPAVGVGPWDGDRPQDADGSLPSHLDPDLLRDGDTRNVVDRYRYWRHEAIVADLDTRRHEVHVAVENWEHDFNIGSVVRTANAFNVAGFHVVGRRRWNRRGAMVTERYLHERHSTSTTTRTSRALAHGPRSDGSRSSGWTTSPAPARWRTSPSRAAAYSSSARRAPG